MELPASVIRFGLYLPALLLGIGLHEWAHAYTAWRLGDPTPEEEGRLSLNPLDHLDPIGTLMMVIACISGLPLLGWGRAVMVRPSAFRNPVIGMSQVAFAGPLMNIVQGTTALLLLHATFRLAGDPHLGESTFLSNLTMLLFNFVLVNFSLATFNLLPIPPLDGSKVICAFANADVVLAIRQMEPYGFMLLLLLLQTRALDLPFGVVMQLVRLGMGDLQVALLLAAFVAVGTVLFVRSLDSWVRR